MKWLGAILAVCFFASVARAADVKISALPASTNLTFDDLLVMVDDPGGTPVTKKITAAALGSTLPAVPTNIVKALATNVSSVVASNTVIGSSNYIGLLATNAVNSIGSSGTNIALSTFTNSGTINTNAFALSKVESFSHISEQKTPWMGVDLWHGANGADWSDLEASNYMTTASVNGLVALGWNIIQLTDGGWGTRTNGHLKARKPATQANPHDFTNLILHAHSLGIRVGTYGEPHYISSCSCGLGSGGPTTPQTNSFGEFPLTGDGAYVETDAADWAAMGFDYIQYDIPGGGNMDYYTYHVRRLTAALRLNSPTKPILIRSSGWAPPGGLITGGVGSDPGIVGFDAHKIATVLSSWRGSKDAGTVWAGAGLDGHWKQAVVEFQSFSKFGYVVGPGHNISFDSPWWNDLGTAQGTNISRGQWSLWAMLPSDIMNFAFVGPSDVFRYSLATNRAFLSIHQDPLVIPATRIVSNATTEVWSRPLNSGAFALMFLNTATNQTPATTNVFLSFTNMGFYGNQTIGEYDVWNNTFTQTVSGMTVSVPFESAALYIIAPLDSSFPFSLIGQDRFWGYNQDSGGQSNKFGPVNVNSNLVASGLIQAGSGLSATGSVSGFGSTMLLLNRPGATDEALIRFQSSGSMFNYAGQALNNNSADAGSWYVRVVSGVGDFVGYRARTNAEIELRTNVIVAGKLEVGANTVNATNAFTVSTPYQQAAFAIGTNGTAYFATSPTRFVIFGTNLMVMSTADTVNGAASIYLGPVALNQGALQLSYNNLVSQIILGTGASILSDGSANFAGSGGSGGVNITAGGRTTINSNLLVGQTITATNGYIFKSNSFPFTAWSQLAPCGCITWMSNATLYLICTNSINGNATTNKLGGL
jgi:Alpha galactosidase C-terminal beta sandwich domain